MKKIFIPLLTTVALATTGFLQAYSPPRAPTQVNNQGNPQNYSHQGQVQANPQATPQANPQTNPYGNYMGNHQAYDYYPSSDYYYQQPVNYGYGYNQYYYDPCCYQPCYYDPCCEDSCWMLGHGALSARFAAYMPFKPDARDLYNWAMPIVELEATADICQHLQAFVNIGYLWDSGKTELKSKSTIRYYPLSFGFKIYTSLDCNTDIYLGGGAVYGFLRLHDNSPYVFKHIKAENWGGTAKLGIIYHTCDCFYWEGFLDYVYQTYEFHDTNGPTGYVERNNFDLSGLKLGFGLGYSF